MAMTVQIIPGDLPVIAEQEANFMVAITNGGATGVSVSSIQMVATPQSGSVEYGSSALAPNASLLIDASATKYFPVQLVFHTPQLSGVNAAPTNQYLITANCSFSDGTTAVAPLTSVIPNIPTNTPVGSAAASGSFRFDAGIDSSLIPLISPV